VKNARRVASGRTGAFLLARTGLLDGRRADPGRMRGPEEFYVRRKRPVYLRDGQVWTSGGETSGIDLALR
jgi:transcriptional regulator GlxA family with amidase domain